MQTVTKTITHGIFNRIATGEYVGNVEQFRTVKVGERVTKYTFEAIDESTLRINGECYRVEDNSEFAIKIMKTKIKAKGGANGLIKLFMDFTPNNDIWEPRIIEKCKPLNKETNE